MAMMWLKLSYRALFQSSRRMLAMLSLFGKPTAYFFLICLSFTVVISGVYKPMPPVSGQSMSSQARSSTGYRERKTGLAESAINFGKGQVEQTCPCNSYRILCENRRMAHVSRNSLDHTLTANSFLLLRHCNRQRLADVTHLYQFQPFRRIPDIAAHPGDHHPLETHLGRLEQP